MTKLTIKVWMDSGANHQSTYRTEFEIDEASWVVMTDEQKEELAKDYAWDRMEWGWSLEEKNT